MGDQEVHVGGHGLVLGEVLDPVLEDVAAEGAVGRHVHHGVARVELLEHGPHSLDQPDRHVQNEGGRSSILEKPDDQLCIDDKGDGNDQTC